MFKVVVFSLGCFGRLCGSLDLRPEVDVSILDCDLKVFLQPLGIEPLLDSPCPLGTLVEKDPR